MNRLCRKLYQNSPRIDRGVADAGSTFTAEATPSSWLTTMRDPGVRSASFLSSSPCLIEVALSTRMAAVFTVWSSLTSRVPALASTPWMVPFSSSERPKLGRVAHATTPARMTPKVFLETLIFLSPVQFGVRTDRDRAGVEFGISERVRKDPSHARRAVATRRGGRMGAARR